jgi:hypothetical protein
MACTCMLHSATDANERCRLCHGTLDQEEVFGKKGNRDVGDGPTTEAVGDREDPLAREWKNREDRKI